MIETTSVEHSPQLEIKEKPEDTPRSVTVTGAQVPGKMVLAFAATTQILDPSYSSLDDYGVFIARDLTPSQQEVLQESLKFMDDDLRMDAAPQMSAAEIANRDRLELLARAYVAGQLSTEAEARLAIVTQRVRRLIPRVTVADFEHLEEMATELERIRLENTERRRRLGLD